MNISWKKYKNLSIDAGTNEGACQTVDRRPFFGRTFVGACEGKACSGGTIRLFIEIA